MTGWDFEEGDLNAPLVRWVLYKDGTVSTSNEGIEHFEIMSRDGRNLYDVASCGYSDVSGIRSTQGWPDLAYEDEDRVRAALSGAEGHRTAAVVDHSGFQTEKPRGRRPILIQPNGDIHIGPAGVHHPELAGIMAHEGHGYPDIKESVMAFQFPHTGEAGMVMDMNGGFYNGTQQHYDHLLNEMNGAGYNVRPYEGDGMAGWRASAEPYLSVPGLEEWQPNDPRAAYYLITWDGKEYRWFHALHSQVVEMLDIPYDNTKPSYYADSGVVTPEGQLRSYDMQKRLDQENAEMEFTARAPIDGPLPVQEYDVELPPGSPSEHAIYVRAYGRYYVSGEGHHHQLIQQLDVPPEAVSEIGFWSPGRGEWVPFNQQAFDMRMDWSFTSKETLPQQQRKWHKLWSEHGLDESHMQPTQIHEFPNGWSVYQHENTNSVNAVGRQMNNCWQGTKPDHHEEQTYQGWTYHSLHDHMGIPRAAWYVHDDPWDYGPYGNTGPQIKQPLAERNKQCGPEEKQMITEWAEQAGVDPNQASWGEPPATLRGGLGEPRAAAYTGVLAVKQHQLNWTPGVEGRAVFEPDGTLHTWDNWRTNEQGEKEYMHHAAYGKEKGIQMIVPFMAISPEGKVAGGAGGRHVDTVEQIDPRLTYRGQNYKQWAEGPYNDLDEWTNPDEFIAHTSAMPSKDDWQVPHHDGALYHIAPVSQRNRITQHGLQPADPSQSTTFGDQQPQQAKNSPTGVYGFSSPYAALSQLQALERNEALYEPGSHDVWQIPADQIHDQQYDPGDFRGDAQVITHDVRPTLALGPEHRYFWPTPRTSAGKPPGTGAGAFGNKGITLVDGTRIEDETNEYPHHLPMLHSLGYTPDDVASFWYVNKDGEDVSLDESRGWYEKEWAKGFTAKTATTVHYDEGQAVNPERGEHAGGAPTIYNPQTDTLHIGKPGQFHLDMQGYDTENTLPMHGRIGLDGKTLFWYGTHEDEIPLNHEAIAQAAGLTSQVSNAIDDGDDDVWLDEYRQIMYTPEQQAAKQWQFGKVASNIRPFVTDTQGRVHIGAPGTEHREISYWETPGAEVDPYRAHYGLVHDGSEVEWFSGDPGGFDDQFRAQGIEPKPYSETEFYHGSTDLPPYADAFPDNPYRPGHWGRFLIDQDGYEWRCPVEYAHIDMEDVVGKAARGGYVNPDGEHEPWTGGVEDRMVQDEREYFAKTSVQQGYIPFIVMKDGTRYDGHEGGEHYAIVDWHKLDPNQIALEGVIDLDKDEGDFNRERYYDNDPRIDWYETTTDWSKDHGWTAAVTPPSENETDRKPTSKLLSGIRKLKRSIASKLTQHDIYDSQPIRSVPTKEQLRNARAVAQLADGTLVYSDWGQHHDSIARQQGISLLEMERQGFQVQGEDFVRWYDEQTEDDFDAQVDQFLASAPTEPPPDPTNEEHDWRYLVDGNGQTHVWADVFHRAYMNQNNIDLNTVQDFGAWEADESLDTGGQWWSYQNDPRAGDFDLQGLKDFYASASPEDPTSAGSPSERQDDPQRVAEQSHGGELITPPGFKPYELGGWGKYFTGQDGKTYGWGGIDKHHFEAFDALGWDWKAGYGTVARGWGYLNPEGERVNVGNAQDAGAFTSATKTAAWITPQGFEPWEPGHFGRFVIDNDGNEYRASMNHLHRHIEDEMGLRDNAEVRIKDPNEQLGYIDPKGERRPYRSNTELEAYDWEQGFTSAVAPRLAIDSVGINEQCIRCHSDRVLGLETGNMLCMTCGQEYDADTRLPVRAQAALRADSTPSDTSLVPDDALAEVAGSPATPPTPTNPPRTSHTPSALAEGLAHLPRTVNPLARTPLTLAKVCASPTGRSVPSAYLGQHAVIPQADTRPIFREFPMLRGRGEANNYPAEHQAGAASPLVTQLEMEYYSRDFEERFEGAGSPDEYEDWIRRWVQAQPEPAQLGERFIKGPGVYLHWDSVQTDPHHQEVADAFGLDTYAPGWTFGWTQHQKEFTAKVGHEGEGPPVLYYPASDKMYVGEPGELHIDIQPIFGDGGNELRGRMNSGSYVDWYPHSGSNEEEFTRAHQRAIEHFGFKKDDYPIDQQRPWEPLDEHWSSRPSFEVGNPRQKRGEVIENDGKHSWTFASAFDIPAPERTDEPGAWWTPKAIILNDGQVMRWDDVRAHVSFLADNDLDPSMVKEWLAWNGVAWVPAFDDYNAYQEIWDGTQDKNTLKGFQAKTATPGEHAPLVNGGHEYYYQNEQKFTEPWTLGNYGKAIMVDGVLHMFASPEGYPHHDQIFLSLRGIPDWYNTPDGAITQAMWDEYYESPKLVISPDGTLSELGAEGTFRQKDKGLGTPTVTPEQIAALHPDLKVNPIDAQNEWRFEAAANMIVPEPLTFDTHFDPQTGDYVNPHNTNETISVSTNPIPWKPGMPGRVVFNHDTGDHYEWGMGDEGVDHHHGYLHEQYGVPEEQTSDYNLSKEGYLQEWRGRSDERTLDVLRAGGGRYKGVTGYENGQWRKHDWDGEKLIPREELGWHAKTAEIRSDDPAVVTRGWKPGDGIGKAFVDVNGLPYLWKIDTKYGRDGDPSHREVEQFANTTGRSYFMIEPNGEVTLLNGEPSDATIISARIPQDPFCESCGSPVVPDADSLYSCQRCAWRGSWREQKDETGWEFTSHNRGIGASPPPGITPYSESDNDVGRYLVLKDGREFQWGGDTTHGEAITALGYDWYEDEHKGQVEEAGYITGPKRYPASFELGEEYNDGSWKFTALGLQHQTPFIYYPHSDRLYVGEYGYQPHMEIKVDEADQGYPDVRGRASEKTGLQFYRMEDQNWRVPAEQKIYEHFPQLAEVERNKPRVLDQFSAASPYGEIFDPRVPGASTPWTPGRYGKGVISPHGKLWHWEVDQTGAPHHVSLSDEFHKEELMHPQHGYVTGELEFIIDPQGKASPLSYRGDPNDQDWDMYNSALTRAGLTPVGEQDFQGPDRYAPFEPNKWEFHGANEGQFVTPSRLPPWRPGEYGRFLIDNDTGQEYRWGPNGQGTVEGHMEVSRRLNLNSTDWGYIMPDGDYEYSFGDWDDAKQQDYRKQFTAAAQVVDMRGANLENEQGEGYPVLVYDNGNVVVGPNGVRHWPLIELYEQRSIDSDEWEERMGRAHGYVQAAYGDLPFYGWYDIPPREWQAVEALKTIWPNLVSEREARDNEWTAKTASPGEHPTIGPGERTDLLPKTKEYEVLEGGDDLNNRVVMKPVLPWKPGVEGKAAVYPDGTVNAWRIDKNTYDPHHADVIPAGVMGVKYIDRISPRGTWEMWGTPTPEVELALSEAGFSPETDNPNEWTFSKTAFETNLPPGGDSWVPGFYGKALLNTHGDMTWWRVPEGDAWDTHGYEEDHETAPHHIDLDEAGEYTHLAILPTGECFVVHQGLAVGDDPDRHDEEYSWKADLTPEQLQSIQAHGLTYGTGKDYDPYDRSAWDFMASAPGWNVHMPTGEQGKEDAELGWRIPFVRLRDSQDIHVGYPGEWHNDILERLGIPDQHQNVTPGYISRPENTLEENGFDRWEQGPGKWGVSMWGHHPEVFDALKQHFPQIERFTDEERMNWDFITGKVSDVWQTTPEMLRQVIPDFDEKVATLPPYKYGLPGKFMRTVDTKEPVLWGDYDLTPEQEEMFQTTRGIPELHHEDVARYLGTMFQDKGYVTEQGTAIPYDSTTPMQEYVPFFQSNRATSVIKLDPMRQQNDQEYNQQMQGWYGAFKPSYQVIDVPASQPGSADEGAYTDEAQYGMLNRRPILVDNSGVIYRGDVNQEHLALMDDAAAQGHQISEHAHYGMHGFGDDPHVVDIWTRMLKPEWRQAVAEALGGRLKEQGKGEVMLNDFFAGVEEKLVHDYPDKHELGLAGLSEPADGWETMGYEQRRPLLLDEDGHIHVGPLDTDHSSFNARLSDKYPDYRNHDMVFGWIGPNPESLRSEDPNYGWYYPKRYPSPEAEAELQARYNVTPQMPTSEFTAGWQFEENPEPLFFGTVIPEARWTYAHE